MSELGERVALVTGASRGIGAAVARRLAAEGAAVALVARTAEPGQGRFGGSLEEVAELIAAQGGRAVPIVADLSAADADYDRVVEEVSARLGPIDILVNNAGVALPVTFGAATAKHWDLTMRLNVWAVWCLARAVMSTTRPCSPSISAWRFLIAAVGWEVSAVICVFRSDGMPRIWSASFSAACRLMPIWPADAMKLLRSSSSFART